MKHHIGWIASAALVLAGCGSKASPQGQAVPANSEVPQAARAGHRVDLGLDTQHLGQLSDKDLVEIRAQLHNAVMSNIRALGAVNDMQQAEAKGRSGMTAHAATIAEIDKALEELHALGADLMRRRAEAVARAHGAGKP